jgi:hypothetical protein
MLPWTSDTFLVHKSGQEVNQLLVHSTAIGPCKWCGGQHFVRGYWHRRRRLYIWSVRDGQLDVVVGCVGSDGTLAVVTEEVQYLPFQCQKGRAAEIQTGWSKPSSWWSRGGNTDDADRPWWVAIMSSECRGLVGFAMVIARDYGVEVRGPKILLGLILYTFYFHILHFGNSSCSTLHKHEETWRKSTKA